MQFLGILNAIFIPLSFYKCIRLNKNFEYKKHTLSHCGSTIYSGTFFNISLMFIGIIQAAFFIYLTNLLLAERQIWPNSIVVSSGLGIFFASVVPTGKNAKMHGLFGSIGFFGAFIATMVFHLHLLYIDKIAALAGLFLLLILGTGYMYFFKKYGNCSIPEIFFLAIAIVWNLFFTGYILV